MKKAFLALCMLMLFVVASIAPVLAYDCANGQHKYILFSHTPATSDKNGLDVFRCELCGEEYESVLLATRHIWGSWIIDKEPTCMEDGKRHRTCFAHNPHDETESISMLGHNYILTIKEPSCEEAGMKIYTCSHDATHTYTEVGEPALGHDFGEWILDSSNKEIRVCSHCHSSEERMVLALPIKMNMVAQEQTQKPVFNTLDTVILSFDFLLILFGVITLYPSLAAIHRVRKLWKEYVANKNRYKTEDQV